MIDPLPENLALPAATAWPIAALLAGLGAFALAAALTPVADKMGRRLQMMDNPGEPRKQHREPTPRTGGFAVVIAFYAVLAGALLVGPLLAGILPLDPAQRDAIRTLLGNAPQVAGPLGAILLGGLAIFALGAIDDRHPLPPLIKLGVQIAVATALWFAGVEARAFLPDPLSLLLTVGWIIALCNALNFLDNMDGLCSGVAALVALGFAWQAWTGAEWLMLAAWCNLAGAALGFWFWNFRRGRPFLGDGGSLFLGFMLAALALRATYYRPGVPSALPVLVPVVLLGVPLFDTATVMFIRWRERRPLMMGDRCHLSHRLEAIGFSRRGAVVAHYVLCAALALLAHALRYLPPGPALSVLGAVALLFVLLFLIEQAAARRIASPRGEGLS